MALSRLICLLLAQIATGAYLEFPIFDSNDRPNDFKDGLPTYVNASINQGQDSKKPLELFLMCTTCTISYIFGEPEKLGLKTLVNSEQMIFKQNAEPV